MGPHPPHTIGECPSILMPILSHANRHGPIFCMRFNTCIYRVQIGMIGMKSFFYMYFYCVKQVQSELAFHKCFSPKQNMIGQYFFNGLSNPAVGYYYICKCLLILLCVLVLLHTLSCNQKTNTPH